ncbi:hypothetical protein [Pseudomonas moorei]|uniref:hypothetical protein n=1 Tax=Pseudomonas moorei TaxID=395599 RepID=UPI001FF5FEF3|nr:hypothetical protein [Pseudomonas moorei]
MTAPDLAAAKNTAPNSRTLIHKRLYRGAFSTSAHRRPPGFHPRINALIHKTNSSFVTDGSLSTFDSSVSCLYFFVSETARNVLPQHPAAIREVDGDPDPVKNAL